jgi:hypothetical protein
MLSDAPPRVVMTSYWALMVAAMPPLPPVMVFPEVLVRVSEMVSRPVPPVTVLPLLVRTTVATAVAVTTS